MKIDTKYPLCSNNLTPFTPKIHFVFTSHTNIRHHFSVGHINSYEKNKYWRGTYYIGVTICLNTFTNEMQYGNIYLSNRKRAKVCVCERDDNGLRR